MGAFYGSIQIRSADRTAIKAAAEQVAQAMKINMLVGPAQNGWIGIYPQDSGQDERVSAELAKLLDGYLLHILLHDDDVFAYWLYLDHKLIDSYWSTPGYFGEKNRAAEKKMSGQPPLFRPIIGDKVEQLGKILDRSEPRPVFMSEKLEAFAKLLEIPHAMQSYEYLLENGELSAQEREQFEEIGSADAKEEPAIDSTSTSNDPMELVQRTKDPAQKHFLTAQVKIWRQADWTGALDDLDRAIELRPDFAEAYNLRGLALQKLGDSRGALPDFQKAVELQPENKDFLTNRGDAKRRRNDLNGALADYDRSLELEPDQPLALNNRGFAKKKLGDLPGALADFDKAIELDPGLVAAFKNRGDTKRAGKDFKAARADYDTAIELQPNSPITFNSRGLCKSALGDLDGSLSDYDRALALNPKPTDRASIMKNRQSVMRRRTSTDAATQKIELNDAIHYAIDQAPDDPLQLPEPLRTVFLVQGAQGVIDNGGLHYFFGHDWEGQPPYSVFVDAYRTIGADAEANALAAAIACFPFPEPHKDQTARREFIEQFLVNPDSPQHRPDSPFELYDICGHKVVWRLLADYVNANAAAFPV